MSAGPVNCDWSNITESLFWGGKGREEVGGQKSVQPPATPSAGRKEQEKRRGEEGRRTERANRLRRDALAQQPLGGRCGVRRLQHCTSSPSSPSVATATVQ
jgi:hypothetical protein